MIRHHPTNFPSLDRTLGGGLPRGGLTVLGGDAGIGCTSMAMAIALGTATRGARTLFLSSEARAEGLSGRAISQISGVPSRIVGTDAESDEQRLAIAAARARLNDLPFRCAVTPVDFVDELPRVAGVDWEVLVIDGLEGVALADSGRQELLAGWIARLKRMAVAQDGVVLLTAHTLLGLSDREDARPRLDDFGAEGAIRGQADLVLGLYREEHYRPDRGVIGSAELSVLKNRNGPRAALDLWFEAECRRFEDLV